MYNTAAAPEATYYSKLAIIELCGWIELSMDYIAENFANKKLKTIPYQDIFRNNIKGKNHGFDYKGNFRKMLYQTVGIHNMEKVEQKLNRDLGSFTRFQTELENLKRLRDDAAHTYIDSMKTYQAPSATIAQLQTIYSILKKINNEIKAL